MPIIPNFTLSQTHTHVVLEVYVPHIRVTDIQVAIVTDDTGNDDGSCGGGSILHVASVPPIYLLVLNFAPHQFDELEEGEAATFEPVQGRIRIELKKRHPQHHDPAKNEEDGGEWWDNLELLGRLVGQKQTQHSTGSNNTAAAAKCKTSNWLQQVVADEGATAAVLDHDGDHGEVEEVELLSSKLCDDNLHVDANRGGYGFMNMFIDIYTDLNRDGLAKEMLEEPWGTSSSDAHEIRRVRRLQREADRFDPDRYLADLSLPEETDDDDYIYRSAMEYTPHWTTRAEPAAAAAAKNSNENGDSFCFFSDVERRRLVTLPYPLLPKSSLSSEKDNHLLLGALDLLFPYVYDHLITCADPTVESAWTVSILSTSLSWLEDCSSSPSPSFASMVERVVVSSLRRSLVYPYLRNLDFGVYVWKNVAAILQAGLRTVVRCFLQMHSILDRSELYYLGNKLFVVPYLAWLQQHPESLLLPQLLESAATIEQFVIRSDLKEVLDLNLVAVEALLEAEAEQDVDSVYSSSSSEQDHEEESSEEEENNSQVSKMSPESEESRGATTAEETVEDVSLSKELLDLSLGSRSHFLLDDSKEDVSKHFLPI
jgi:protein SHQ1